MTNLKLARSEMDEAVKGLEMKLNRSLVTVAQEIDQLKSPLHDMLQDIAKERETICKELERTKESNRQLVLLNCQRTNLFSVEAPMSPRSSVPTITSRAKTMRCSSVWNNH